MRSTRRVRAGNGARREGARHGEGGDHKVVRDSAVVTTKRGELRSDNRTRAFAFRRVPRRIRQV